MFLLRETEGSIKNGQPRDTENIGYTRHRAKANKTKPTPKTKEMPNKNPTKTPRVDTGTREG